MNLAIWKRVFTARYGAALGLSIFFQGALIALLVPLAPILITEQIKLDKHDVIIYYLISTVMGISITLITGWLSDGLIARYKLVAIGGLIGAVGYIGLSQATLPIHAWLAVVAMAGTNVVFPQLFAVAKAGVVAGWEPKDQVMGITALRTLYSLGFVFGTAITSVLARYEVRTVFLLIAAVAFLVTLGAAFLLRRIEAFIRQEEQRATADRPASAVRKPRDLPLWVLIVPLLSLLVLRGADSTRGVYLALVMFQLFKDASIAPLMFGITAAAEVITMSVMGYVASRIGEKSTIAIGAVFGAIYYAILSTSQSLPVLYAAHVLYAVFAAALLGVAMAYVQGLMAHRAGMGGSLFMATYGVGNFIGILVPLMVKDYDQTIFIAPIFLCLIGAAMLLFGDRTAQVTARLRSEEALATAK
jgi:SET family sugar efflux transporter-like MFS transporter